MTTPTPDRPTPHRATEKQWNTVRTDVENPGYPPDVDDLCLGSCILELRDTLSLTREALAALEQRVGALEELTTTALADVADLASAVINWLEAFEPNTDDCLTPTPDRPTQPPAVPWDVMALIIDEAERVHWDGPITQWLRDFARTAANLAHAWTWAQREEEVQEARRQGEAMADAELEACCQWLRDQGGCHGIATMLRAARRPAPPTLREQALADVLYLRSMEGALLDIPGDTLHERLSRITAALQEGADG